MSTWLLAIARNLLIDHFRAGAPTGSSVPLQDVDPQALPTVEGIVNLGLEPRLATALNDLADREREILALRYGGELSGPEIASLTGLSLSNVQQIISRTLKRLRTAMDG
jgi:RNA polymerase sigma-70 factor (ECF subfamily)